MYSPRKAWQFICPVIEKVANLFHAVFCTAKMYKGRHLESTTLKGWGI